MAQAGLLFAQGVILLLLAPWVLRAVRCRTGGLIGGLLSPTASERVRDLERPGPTP